MKGRWFDGYLRVEGWDSGYVSVQRLLDHLSRRTKSESSRIQYLQTLATLCRREDRTPDQLVRLTRHEAEDAVQSYLDTMAKQGRSKRWVNVCMTQLITYFRVNGFSPRTVAAGSVYEASLAISQRMFSQRKAGETLGMAEYTVRDFCCRRRETEVRPVTHVGSL
ncbi:MAG: hypothetical protein JRN09_09035 [Nitrososphaerota archaeon]|nr:hypothetical protein [Nitrososphaerota archaeon]